jgi:DNA polymerase-3 subunit epsilon
MRRIQQLKELEDYEIEDVETIRLLGLPLIELEEDNVALETTFTPIENQRFCIVDIETTGSNSKTDNIIEVGAILYQGGKVCDRFESFVHVEHIPENITYLTGISLKDVQEAPSIENVLEKFRLFLKDAVFVAHNVNFDYYFISDSMQRCGFGPLLNRRLCSIDLAHKTFEAPKYGLGFLIEFLNIDVATRHRAYADALATVSVVEKSFENLPQNIITTEDLINFAKPQPRRKKKEKN